MYISSDTNIWIDFYEIGHINHPFKLNYKYFISEETYNDEFCKTNTLYDELRELGLQTTELTEEEVGIAFHYHEIYRKLSLYDAFALAIAKNRDWTLLTGDMPLRKAAIKEGIEVHGTIWIYDQLKEQELISETEYFDAIDQMISATKKGKCRFPMEELFLRKNTKPWEDTIHIEEYNKITTMIP